MTKQTERGTTVSTQGGQLAVTVRTDEESLTLELGKISTYLVNDKRCVVFLPFEAQGRSLMKIRRLEHVAQQNFPQK
ncbi:MAG: hypothetical protein KatS3mg087_1151 [Patescibacteria group bacterium]|nr:MAG: hypothetical protein KatS3mg087_1151 [Patescibacteria group bacterium]